MQSRSWHSFYSFQFSAESSPWPYGYVSNQRAWSPAKPVFHMEPHYDQEPCCGSGWDFGVRRNRRTGWWAALAEAMGVAYGGSVLNWDTQPGSAGQMAVKELDRQGARDTAMVGIVMQRYPIASLAPDTDGSILTGERGSNDTYATAARSSDGSLIMAYTPVQRNLTINLGKLSGPGKAQWINPSTGKNVGTAEPVTYSGTRSFTNPLSEDALLVITAA